jgi:Tol biopolymer transport system component
MGEVYRARDTRLDRPVAIKLLPASFADRAERRQRFQIEARAISSLQHPHICTLFDIGEEDGQLFLVLEYLEGETLDDRLTHGPLPAHDVLRYASQIASALDHAHRARIVHRDLKPSNVMLTDSGAKLLDFGLARATALDTAGAPTVSFPQDKLTAEGAIVGTFRYMAPEQVEGKEADERTDIFAFGALLYEMATGQRAFEGTSQASLIASILTAQPPPVSAARATRRADALSDALDHVVERCLAKSPNDRWQTARDLKAELEWITEGKSRSAGRHSLKNRPRTREVLAWLAAAAAVLVSIAALTLRTGEQPAPLTRFTLTVPFGMTIPHTTGDTFPLAVSPDGRHVAFRAATVGGGDGLWVQSLDSASPRALVSGEPVLAPFWSPDSRFIGFFAPSEGALKKVELSGGPARTICAAVNSGVPLWANDGTIFFSEFRRGLFRVAAEGGQPTQLTTVDQAHGELNHFWPSLLPDGRHFFYTATRLDDSGRRATPIVYAGSLDSTERTEVARLNSRLEYTRSGRVLYVHEGALLAQTFDVKNLRLTGEPVRIAEGLEYSRSTGAAAFSASDDVLAYHGVGGELELVWFDRSGQTVGSVGTPQRFGHVRISPDGKRVATEVTDARLGTQDVWIYDLARDVPTRLTTDVNSERVPIWSPDGGRIAFVSDRGTGVDASADFFVKRADGMGEEEAFFAQVGAQWLEDWSRDDSITYRDESRETGDNMWILPLQGDRKPWPFLRTRFEEFGGRFSPDSTWMAFVSSESGANEVYVAPVRGSGEKIRVSTGGGITPRWRADGRELFYLSGDGKVMMAAPISVAPVLKVGTPAPLFTISRELGFPGRARNVAHDVAPDGQRFLFAAVPRDQTPSRISVILNWTALLRQ